MHSVISLAIGGAHISHWSTWLVSKETFRDN